MANLFDPPQIFDLPLSTGRDLFCEFIYEPLVVDVNGDPILDASGNPQYVAADYPVGAVVTLVIDADPEVAGVATISGNAATVLIDKALVMALPPKLLWRLEITYTTGVGDVLANGMTIRSDGKHD